LAYRPGLPGARPDALEDSASVRVAGCATMVGMRTPPRPLPDAIARWTSRVRYLRWLDALVAWPAAWALLATVAPGLPADVEALVALGLVGGLAWLPPVRVRWRPVSAWAALRLSRRLVPGDRVWFVRPDHAELVVVTARRGLRITIAGRDAAEGISVRRTRVLLVPVASAPGVVGTRRRD
jgi:hypothetical protein